MNLFATVLTYTAPSANYRGESPTNRAVIQKITRERHEYAIISPEAIRNAVRETLHCLRLPCNRTRLHDEEQLAVKFTEYPDAEKYADDFFMGWLIAATGKDREKIKKELKEKKRDPGKFTFKRDSVVRMNMAVALEPYRHDSVFTQSPLNVDSPWKNAESSQLLHRETVVTAYQYPFALSMKDCECKVDGCNHEAPKDNEQSACKQQWTKTLLKAIGQLNNVAGNHARSYFEFSPASIIVRLTNQLVAGFDTYGFQIREGRHELPEIIDGIQKGDYPGGEFYLGGKIVKDMDGKTLDALKAGGMSEDRLNRSPQRLLEKVSHDAFPVE